MKRAFEAEEFDYSMYAVDVEGVKHGTGLLFKCPKCHSMQVTLHTMHIWSECTGCKRYYQRNNNVLYIRNEAPKGMRQGFVDRVFEFIDRLLD